MTSEAPPTAEQERAAIVAWLREKASDEMPAAMKLRFSLTLLWALVHPVRFKQEYARFMALNNAADAIERGEHVKETSGGRRPKQ